MEARKKNGGEEKKWRHRKKLRRRKKKQSRLIYNCSVYLISTHKTATHRTADPAPGTRASRCDLRSDRPFTSKLYELATCNIHVLSKL